MEKPWVYLDTSAYLKLFVLESVRAGLAVIEIVRVTDDILKLAEAVTLQAGARALDAIHIASALVFRDATSIEPTFMTADTKQGIAA
jgi:predicted nucleic acid-binding protein